LHGWKRCGNSGLLFKLVLRSAIHSKEALFGEIELPIARLPCVLLPIIYIIPCGFKEVICKFVVNPFKADDSEYDLLTGLSTEIMINLY
jgi:hypothetical protein